MGLCKKVPQSRRHGQYPVLKHGPLDRSADRIHISQHCLEIILGHAPQLTAPCVTQTVELNSLVSVPCPGIRKVTIGAPTDFLFFDNWFWPNDGPYLLRLRSPKVPQCVCCVLFINACMFLFRAHPLFYLRFVFACLRFGPHPPRKEWLHFTWVKKSLRVLFGVSLRVLVPSCFRARGCAEGFLVLWRVWFGGSAS